MKHLILSFSLLFLLSNAAQAQKNPKYNDPTSLKSLAEAFAQKSWGEFRELLGIPNDAHFPDDIAKNREWCIQAFEKRGFQMKELATERLPLLLAERPSPKAKKTVLIYLQIDGQPVDPRAWDQDNPWQPVLKARKGDKWEIIDWNKINDQPDPDWRIFARATSDAKGPVAMFLAALDAQKSIGKVSNYHIKVIMDFEEELGSPPLPSAVTKYKEDLAADMLIIFDGPRHISNRPTLTFGARGIATIQLTVFGPRKPQHSGHYGNYAPNPAFRLSKLLAGMKDEQGRVSIPGYYDGIELDAPTKSILAQVPDDEKAIQKSLGIAEIDAVGNNYQEAIQYPSLNIRGMSAGWVKEEVRTIVPDQALAEIDVRLVPESNPKRLLQLIRDYVKDQGYLVLDREPTEEERSKYSKIARFTSKISYQAFRTDFNSEVGLWLDRALQKAFGEAPIKIRNSGGSIPIAPFVNTLGIPAVTVPTVNRDNNQHSPNENIRLGNYVEGVRTFLAILLEKL